MRTGIALAMLLVLSGCNGNDSRPDGQDGTDADGTDADDTEADGTDGGEGSEGFSEPVWSWCPDASAYIGGNYAYSLNVTSEALYCAPFNESRTLEEERDWKALLRIPAGTYPLPDSDGSTPFRLPICLRYGGSDHPALAEAGTIATTFVTSGNKRRAHWGLSQPLRTAGGQVFELNLAIDIYLEENQTQVALDGAHWNPCSADTGYVSFQVCRSDCRSFEDVRHFDSCRFDTTPEGHHRLGFERGSLEIALRIGCSMAGTQPGLMHHAQGVLDGKAFYQSNYWSLIYNPEHHHFLRDAIVLFDKPEGLVCGLRAEQLNPFCCFPSRPDCPEACSTRLSLVDCNLSKLEDLPLQSIDWK